MSAFGGKADALERPSECLLIARSGHSSILLPEDRRITYRIGINIGDIIVEGEDIYGDGVNVAARLEGLAEPGGICVQRLQSGQVQGGAGFRGHGRARVTEITLLGSYFPRWFSDFILRVRNKIYQNK